MSCLLCSGPLGHSLLTPLDEKIWTCLCEVFNVNWDEHNLEDCIRSLSMCKGCANTTTKLMDWNLTLKRVQAEIAELNENLKNALSKGLEDTQGDELSTQLRQLLSSSQDSSKLGKCVSEEVHLSLLQKEEEEVTEFLCSDVMEVQMACDMQVEMGPDIDNNADDFEESYENNDDEDYKPPFETCDDDHQASPDDSSDSFIEVGAYKLKDLRIRLERLTQEQIDEAVTKRRGQSLQMPITTAVNNVVYTCSVCGEACESRRTLSAHHRDKHNAQFGRASWTKGPEAKKEKRTCPICKKIFNRRYIKEHVRTHSNDKPCDCETCGQKFFNASKLRRHEQKAHVIGDRRGLPYCKPCDIMFDAFPALNEHRAKLHPVQINPNSNFKCDVCGKVLNNRKALSKHRYVHLPRKHICEVCGKAFQDPRPLKNHVLLHTNETPFTCEVCGMRVRYLEAHRRGCLEKRPDSEKNFQCSYCNKMFFQEVVLKAHMLTHTNAEKFECEVCHEKFRSKCFYVQHRRKHFPEEKIPCSMCSKSFFRPQDLKWHIEYDHLNNRETCSICGYVAAAKNAFRSHMLIHGEKRFKCDICGKQFGKTSHLKRHKATHEKSGGMKTESTQKEEQLEGDDVDEMSVDVDNDEESKT